MSSDKFRGPRPDGRGTVTGGVGAGVAAGDRSRDGLGHRHRSVRPAGVVRAPMVRSRWWFVRSGRRCHSPGLEFRRPGTAQSRSRWAYSYARTVFRAAGGFLAAWFYWITAGVSRAGMVVGWILYVEVFITSHNRVFSILIGFVGLWVPAAKRLGIKNMASVQVVTTALVVPLVLISTVGLFYVD